MAGFPHITCNPAIMIGMILSSLGAGVKALLILYQHFEPLRCEAWLASEREISLDPRA